MVRNASATDAPLGGPTGASDLAVALWLQPARAEGLSEPLGASPNPLSSGNFWPDGILCAPACDLFTPADHGPPPTGNRTPGRPATSPQRTARSQTPTRY